MLVDLDGVLYVEERPIAGAVQAVQRLRERPVALRFVTNTTAYSRGRTLDKLYRLGFSVASDELVTPRPWPSRTAASATTDTSR